MNKNPTLVLALLLFPTILLAFGNDAPTIGEMYEIKLVTDHDGEVGVVENLVETVKDLPMEILIEAVNEERFSHKRLEHVPATTPVLELLEDSTKSYMVLEAFLLHAELKATPALKKKYPDALILRKEAALVNLFRGYITRLKRRSDEIKNRIEVGQEEEPDEDLPPVVQKVIKKAMARNDVLSGLEIPKREYHLLLKE